MLENKENLNIQTAAVDFNPSKNGVMPKPENNVSLWDEVPTGILANMMILKEVFDDLSGTNQKNQVTSGALLVQKREANPIVLGAKEATISCKKQREE